MGSSRTSRTHASRVHTQTATLDTVATGRPKLDPNEPTKHTRIRHIRVPDDPWIPAAQRAEADGTTISAVVRALLERYAAGDLTL